MSVSQNKKNEQQNNLCTTLTEQWKKGELEVGEEYWVILTDEWYLRSPVVPVRAFYSCECEFEGYLDNDIKEVLAPVPSYEEWRDLQEYKRIVNSYNMKPIDYDIACETVNKLLDEKTILKAEIIQLKELLKKVRNAWVIYKPYDRHQLCERIDNVIGEKK